MATEDREVIGELSQEYIEQFDALNKENNLLHEAVQTEMNILTNSHMERIKAIQAQGRVIWDKIGKEFNLDVVKETLKVDKDGTTGITKLYRIVKK